MSTLLRPYTTVDDVCAEMRVSSGEYTTKITDAINLASRWVDDFCGRDFWYHDYSTSAYETKCFDCTIVLPWPILSLVSVEARGVVYSDEIYWSDRTIDVGYHSDVFSELMRWEFVRVFGTFGYALQQSSPNTNPPVSIPASVRRATTLIAAAWTGEYRVEQVGLDGQRVSVAESKVPSDAKLLLSPFKSLVV